MAACTSCSVNSGMLSLSSFAFSFSASFSSVSLFVSLVAFNFVWYVRLHLTVSAFMLVLLHIRVYFAEEFPEDIGNAFSGCDDFILFVSYVWNECFLPR